MVRHFLRVTFVSGLTAALGLVTASCSSGGGTGARPGSGGTGTGTGGTGQGGVGGGAGGVGGVAGGAGGVGGGAGGVGGSGPTTICPTDGQPCCGGLGSCVPTSCLASSQSSQLAVDACTTAGQVCAPTDILSGGAVMECRSINNSEGRCASTCIPQVGQLSERLPQANCTATQRCAPCYNPVDGVLTGICNIGTDAPKEAAYVFADCGAGRGKCVPSDLVPADRRSVVPPDTCATGELCAPTEAIMDPNYKFPACTSAVVACNCPGACIPKYVADSQGATGALLTQDTCARADDRCAPCINPIDQTVTGACT